MFGAIRSSSDEIGFPATSDSDGVDSSNREKVVMPYIDAFAKFRDDVRKVAREAKVGGVLDLCDAVRDDVLPHLGVRLEDKEGEISCETRGLGESSGVKKNIFSNGNAKFFFPDSQVSRRKSNWWTKRRF